MASRSGARGVRGGYVGIMQPRTLLRSAAAIVATGFLASAAAPAASAAGLDATPAVRTVVNASGLRISWPGTTAVPRVAPGTTFVVRVRRTAKAPRNARARITITRLAHGTTKRRTVRRATVRRGTASVRVGRTAGVRYRLVVRVDKRTWRSTVEVAAPAPVTPAPLPPQPCAPAGHLVAPDTATVGAVIPLGVVNSGAAHLGYGAATTLQRLVDGVWGPVPASGMPRDLAYPLWLRSAEPGTTGENATTIWSTLEPGVYRVGQPVDASCRSGTASIPADPASLVLYSNPITVVTP